MPTHRVKPVTPMQQGVKVDWLQAEGREGGYVVDIYIYILCIYYPALSGKPMGSPKKEWPKSLPSIPPKGKKGSIGPIPRL